MGTELSRRVELAARGGFIVGLFGADVVGVSLRRQAGIGGLPTKTDRLDPVRDLRAGVRAVPTLLESPGADLALTAPSGRCGGSDRVVAEPDAPGDRGRITAFRGILSPQRPRLLSWVVRRRMISYRGEAMRKHLVFLGVLAVTGLVSPCLSTARSQEPGKSVRPLLSLDGRESKNTKAGYHRIESPEAWKTL